MTLSLKRFSFKAMGSVCEIQIYDESRVNAKKIVQQLAGEITRLEKKYAFNRRDSFITQINLSAGEGVGTRLDKESLTLFEHALNCFEKSEGLYDITSCVLYRIWDFNIPRVPTEDEIEALRPHIGFHKLKWRNARLQMPAGMYVDFGNIVKEYAADVSAQLARKLGIKHGLVNLGGDFAVIGPRPDGEPWAVGVVNPKAPDSLIAKLDISSGGVATSGSYSHAFNHGGQSYSFLFNPKTGWPSNGLRAATVASNLCVVAGSAATIAMLKEETEAITELKASGLPHVYMKHDETIDGNRMKS